VVQVIPWRRTVGSESAAVTLTLEVAGELLTAWLDERDLQQLEDAVAIARSGAAAIGALATHGNHGVQPLRARIYVHYLTIAQDDSNDPIHERIQKGP
jgi:hypothetical protein